MHASLALHLALFRRQKAQIARSIDGQTSAFRAYEARYQRRTATFEKTLGLRDVHRRLLSADIVYVGDYHTLDQAQQSYLSLVEKAVASGRRVVLALECVQGRHQAALDSYLAGRLPERELLEQLGHLSEGFHLWSGARALLSYARRHRLSVLGIDRRARGEEALSVRDTYAAERIARVARAEDKPLVMVLMGQYHVAPCHLPSRVDAKLPKSTARQSLVIYQNCERIYWTLARAGKAGSVEAVELRDGSLCLLNTSPVVCQRSFLDYLEAEAGDAPLREHSAAERFKEMASLLSRLLDLPVGAALDDVEVATAAHVSALSRIQRRGSFSRVEIQQLKRHILSRESCYIPRARTAYLASMSLNHAAEEAAHFVRHCSVGEAMERPRRTSEAFYARCLEEALGFFGSKVINPRRNCAGTSEWAHRFGQLRGVDRQVAAFVLAHKAAESGGPEEAFTLLPLRRDRLFHGVSHALGYMLGEALYRAFDEGRVDRPQMRALFQDPFTDPRALYMHWVRQLG